ncbi:methyltransferase domain-containing protein [Nocardia gipuzkoensis]|nr:methyltransferase domain-containing protein [Nocardia gipuzkoensis]MDE1675151.1 methyltransferase domain-containing protein [Nocardia gipuzkoensis]
MLDVGTGAGGALPALAATGARVEAIDVNPAVVALATEYAERSGVADRVAVRQAICTTCWPSRAGSTPSGRAR